MSTRQQRGSLVVLRPGGDEVHLHGNRTVLATGLDGFVRPGGEQGLFVHETRMLSEYRYLIGETEPRPVGVSAISARESAGYYVSLPPGRSPGPPDHGSGLLLEDTQQTVELFLRRRIAAAVGHDGGDRIEEFVRVTNYSDMATTFVLRLIIDADFLGLPEIRFQPLGLGRLERKWDDTARELRFDWRASYQSPKALEKSTVHDHRSLAVAVTAADGPVRARDAIEFPITLDPGARWRAEIHLRPRVSAGASSRPAAISPRPAASFDVPGDRSRAGIVSATLRRARTDLESLRLHDLDGQSQGWTMAAGVPLYVALFGRDVLTTSWQAAMVTPDMMRGSLKALAALQGLRHDDWRDEAPGRFLHEAHTGPLETLNVNPRGRYYGSVTTSGFFPLVLAEFWHWTGDEDFVRSLVPHALDGLRWLDQEGDLDDDGFIEYQTRSADGVTHQGWKDSADAIVYPDGRLVEPPIATCEEQAFVYVAKLHLAGLLWMLRERPQAKRLFREARRLKRRFNETFWLPDQQFLAMALDRDKCPVASIGSNAGHCLAAGIVQRDRAQAIADRLMAPDMFSGWGIRTLSCEHPSFNPFSYHRGTVWPVEQGSFVLGLVRYGLHRHAERLARAVLDAAALFEHSRLPELFGGQPRDREHPFPALYPQANAPQAWSASTLFLLVQSMLGLYPYAPAKFLFLDPRLPRWLPEITLRDLQVGRATVTVRFRRQANGTTDYKVLKKEGDLHIVRQASPWSLTEPVTRRIRTLIASALPRH